MPFDSQRQYYVFLWIYIMSSSLSLYISTWECKVYNILFLDSLEKTIKDLVFLTVLNVHEQKNFERTGPLFCNFYWEAILSLTFWVAQELKYDLNGLYFNWRLPLLLQSQKWLL